MSSIFFSKRLRYLSRKYHFQTTYNEIDRMIVSSLFNEGRLLDMRSVPVAENTPEENVVELIMKIHEEILEGYEILLKLAEAGKDSGRLDLNVKLGSALMAKKLYDEAIELLDSTPAQSAGESAISLLRGKLYLAKEMPERAESEFKNAVKLSPDYPDIRNLLGETYLMLRQPIPAIEQFKMATTLNVYYDRAFYNLGLGYILNGLIREDFELAKDIQRLCRETFDKAVSLNPGYIGDDFRAGLQSLDEARLQEAYDRLTAVPRQKSAHAKFDNLLEIYLRCVFGERGVTEKTIMSYIQKIEDLLTTNPGYADLQNELGMAYTLMGKVMGDKAMDHFKLALEINPNFKKAQKNLKLSENELRGFDVLLEAILK